MDPSVLNALERWPEVPAVYGWLSLSARGDWRLHELPKWSQVESAAKAAWEKDVETRQETYEMERGGTP